jgi:cytochrome c553
MKNCRRRIPLGVLLLNQPAHCEEPKEYRDMTTERPEYRNLGFRVFVFLAVLANLILTIALIAQVREVQQRVENLPPDLASKRDVAALRPLRVRQILTQNCVECHSTRRLGTTVSMEPAEIQRTIERLPSHTSVNIPQDQMERITASLLVARCARCHGEDTLNLMVLKTVPERIATIRRMAALPGSGVRADQVLATAQAFEKLINETDGGRASSGK